MRESNKEVLKIIFQSIFYGYFKDIIGVGCRVYPEDLPKGTLKVARYINEDHNMWHDVDNAYPEGQREEFKGMPTLYTDNERKGGVNPQITPRTKLYVFKMDMERRAYLLGDWFKGQDELGEYIRRWEPPAHKEDDKPYKPRAITARMTTEHEKPIWW